MRENSLAKVCHIEEKDYHRANRTFAVKMKRRPLETARANGFNVDTRRIKPGSHA